MKKKLLIILSVIVILAVAVVLVITLGGNNQTSDKTAEHTDYTDLAEEQVVNKKFEKALISILDKKDIEKFAEDENVQVFFTDDKKEAYLSEFNFFGYSSEMSVFLDDNKKIETFNIYSTAFDASDIINDGNTVKLKNALYGICRGLIEDFAALFGVNFTHDFQLSYFEGDFEFVESADDLTAFVSGDAYINFAVHDENGYYYVMHIAYYEPLIEVTIRKYTDIEEYKDYFSNISLCKTYEEYETVEEGTQS